MTASLYELLTAFDAHGLQDAARGWKSLAKAVDGLDTRHRTQVNGPLRQHWTGGDASAAFAYLERTEQQLDIVRVEAEAVALTLNTVAERMQQAKTDLTGAVHEAQAAGLTVAVDGTVQLPAQTWDDRHDQDAQDARRALAYTRSACQGKVDAALKAAQQASDQGRTALGRLGADILSPTRGAGGVAETKLDAASVMGDLGLAGGVVPDGQDPKKTAEWWKGLTPDQQETYLALRPAELGRLDGLPSSVRDKANRLVLDQKLDMLQAATPGESGLDAETYQKRRVALESIKQKLDEADGNDEMHQMFLLGIDSDASDGRAIVSRGNPDKALHTAIFVPGTSTDLNSVPGQMDHVTRLQKAAEDALTNPGGKVAVISWLGYDAPEWSTGSPLLTSRGKDAAPDLRLFGQGVRVAQTDNVCSHLTVIGHSYGSYAVGVAAREGGGLPVDDIVALGSPGMGVSNASELGIDPKHVWIGEAKQDFTRLVGGVPFGPSPHMDGFGGNNIKVDTTGHGHYWDDQSASLKNQGRVIVGVPPETVPKDNFVEGTWYW
ncbi:alpha/beta hydrolase [Kitasatospora sp. NPDC056184]|uniref:alpha/beta hydrolase n=1 Tax=Kitasatospora sp. NPDC056184 TaxID=3345738 RepID=UPI0035D8E729